MADSDQIINNINNLGNKAAGGAAGADTAVPGAGAGAGDFIQGLTAGATSMANGAQQMLACARSGELKFDPTTGQSLINTLNSHIEDLDGVSAHARFIAQSTPLGMTQGGQVMAEFNMQVAATGGQAFLPAHQQFTESLKSTVEAIKIAMENYAKAEEENAGKFEAKD